MLTPEEAQNILTSYSWIRVRQYVMNEKHSWKERIADLQKHHKQECDFLQEYIEKKLHSTIPSEIFTVLPIPEASQNWESTYSALDQQHILTTNMLVEVIRARVAALDIR